jgi:hypothetical protein
MVDRSFSETELRLMMEEATSLREEVDPGRFTVSTSHNWQRWEVIVEPDPADQVLVVVTAYQLD